MLILKGLEKIASYLESSVNGFGVGTGTSTKDYTDEGLETEVFTTSNIASVNKGNGELVFTAEIDYTEANGYTLTESGITINGDYVNVLVNYPLEKNSNEKYIYSIDLAFYPKESLL